MIQTMIERWGKMNKFPDSIIVLGNRYGIQYDQPFPAVKPTCFGYISYQSRLIFVKCAGRKLQDVWHTLTHEILHAICHEFKIIGLKGLGNERKIDVLALALVDTCFRNGFIKGGL